ncbi:MAG: PucR family transcriptional regulator, partial [Microbacteriaceae bacterium]|nr:PucR family transcriptional regulator [Microbacteriaceae bacterium]
MPVTVRDLVEQAGLGLRFHPAAGGAGTPAVEAEIAWAHASDLLDPTPWLQAGQLLLTDGSHLRAGEFDEAAAAAYAGRLRRTGIVALGF